MSDPGRRAQKMPPGTRSTLGVKTWVLALRNRQGFSRNERGSAMDSEEAWEVPQLDQ
jgi:hypothetical protein